MTTSVLIPNEDIKTISFSALPSSRDPESAIQRQYQWVVEIAGVSHTITLFHSKKTGTVKASLDGKQFHQRYIPPNDIYYCYFYAVNGIKGCRMDIIHTPEGVELSINEKNFTELFKEQNPGVEISKVRILPSESSIRQLPAPPKSVKKDSIVQPQYSTGGSQKRINSDSTIALQHRPSSTAGSQSALKFSFEMSGNQEVRAMDSVLTGSPVPFQPPIPIPMPYGGYPNPPVQMQTNQPRIPLNDNPFNQTLGGQKPQSEIGPSMLYQGPTQNYQNQVPQQPIVPLGTSLVFPDDPVELNEMMKKAASFLPGPPNPTIPPNPSVQQTLANNYGRGSQQSLGVYRPGSDNQLTMQQIPQPTTPPAMMPMVQQSNPSSSPQSYVFDPILSHPFSVIFAEKLHAVVVQNMQQEIYGSVPPAIYGSVPPAPYGYETPANYSLPPQQDYYYGQTNYGQPPPTSIGQYPMPPPQPPTPSQQYVRPSSNHSNSGRNFVPEGPSPPQLPPFRYPTPMPQQPGKNQPPYSNPTGAMRSASEKDIPKQNPNLQPPPVLQRPPLPKAASNNQQPVSNTSIDKVQARKNTDSQISLKQFTENRQQIPPQLSASGMDQLISSTPNISVLSASKESAKPPKAQLRQVESQIYE